MVCVIYCHFVNIQHFCVVSSKKKSSFVWKYFIRMDTGGKCKICHVFVKSSGNTRNLKYHLQRIEAFFTNSLDADVNVDIPNQQCDIITISPSQSAIPASNSISCSSSTNQMITMPISSKFEGETSRKKRLVQPDIGTAIHGGANAGKITNSILFMIAKDNLPFATVEKEGFRNLMHTIIPLYKIPSRKTITTLIEEKYMMLSTIIKERLSLIENITLTADVWTDTLNTKSYLGVTGHYAWEDTMKSVTISVTELTQRHTAEYLGKWLFKICNEWGIKTDTITVIVTDNGANIVKAALRKMVLL
ncbi:uncharacterized protein LOC118647741 [Monomorium pharaonis]|uniref:uncharacterized protein LOC118647741 n=1 Tax=Monomorium pharaonis TaxID=307658 RepID=UPI0017469D7A|nr:uncharacterized protein LOC118647741 [Monomorium pharaonis]